jgi:hypothetical protein
VTDVVLLTPPEAKAKRGIHLQTGERLIVVDGAIWGRVERYRGTYRVRPFSRWEPLDGYVTTTSEIPALVAARLADGTLHDPAERLAREAAAAAQREAEARARKAAEAHEWLVRAEKAVLAFQQGARLEDAILDAMRWARSR